MSINSVALSGRLTTDIEIRKTQEGKSVCAFTLAVQRDKENVDFIECVAWERQADLLAQYKRKGSYVAITGRLRKRKWQTQSGENRYVTEVITQNIDLGAKEDGTEQQQSNGYNPTIRTNQASQGYNRGNDDDGFKIDSDDLPF